MEIPTTLKHKPVFVCPDYDRVDGKQAYESDAKGLSLGLAQWNERGSVDISAKVWRHTGEKWSRQSEELPLHRVLDLAIMLCAARQYIIEGQQGVFQKTVGVQGDAMRLSLCEQNEFLKGDLTLFANTLSKDDERLSERLSILSSLLSEMGY